MQGAPVTLPSSSHTLGLGSRNGGVHGVTSAGLWCPGGLSLPGCAGMLCLPGVPSCSPHFTGPAGAAPVPGPGCRQEKCPFWP